MVTPLCSHFLLLESHRNNLRKRVLLSCLLSCSFVEESQSNLEKKGFIDTSRLRVSFQNKLIVSSQPKPVGTLYHHLNKHSRWYPMNSLTLCSPNFFLPALFKNHQPDSRPRVRSALPDKKSQFAGMHMSKFMTLDALWVTGSSCRVLHAADQGPRPGVTKELKSEPKKNCRPHDRFPVGERVREVRTARRRIINYLFFLLVPTRAVRGSGVPECCVCVPLGYSTQEIVAAIVEVLLLA